MRPIPYLLIFFLVFSGCKEEKKESAEEHQHTSEKPVTGGAKALSPHTSAMAMVGGAHVHIDYSSPGVRNRIIFGGLLAYDEVWQAGAHMATWIETNKDLIIKGETLEAGKYGMFAIPSREKWTWIFNKNWDQHGKDEYSETDDVIRIDVLPEKTDNITEQLTYQVRETGPSSGIISMSWEQVKIEIPFTVKQ
ncbi:DUF2911 domain-containing protein [Robiginitalea sp. IMCC44478]|uniref:DUF2911 domain-containing protein n=1 Tax=Robiginitalea sp. IMCC44478 TaxID=3459122 RepID=UPI004043416D